MLLLILLASSPFLTHQVSLQCANPVVIETQPAPGPGSLVAVLKVFSDDDHSRNSHQCNAQYQLQLTTGAEAAPRIVELLTSDDDYDRSLFLRLSGFSRDGKRVLGILSERGEHGLTMLFDYYIREDKVQLTDIKRQFAPIIAANCEPIFEVIGTTESGAIVVALNSSNRCARGGRWLLDSPNKPPRRVTRGMPILGIYKPKG